MEGEEEFDWQIDQQVPVKEEPVGVLFIDPAKCMGC